ncbi:MAG TPA: polysaccharide deacetylase family protein, partial [Ktedonobacteraceae bacterium]
MRTQVYLFFILGLICGEVALGAAALPRSSEDHLFARSVSTVVALTFDDGPQPVFTPQVLNVLQRYGVPATFFCIGSQVQEYPEIVRHIFEEGNVVGNHTWNHPDLTTLSPDAIRWQLRSTSAIIQQTTGVAPTLFRPPYGATNTMVGSIATQLGLVQTEWTVDTVDWQRPGVPTLVSTVLGEVHSGSIILMHDGGGDRSQTVQALPQIIQGLQ